MAYTRRRVRRVATAPVATGNAGSDRLNHTVIGDAASLAAHLEAGNKAYGTAILVTEDTARAEGLDGFDFFGRRTVRDRRPRAIVCTPMLPPS